MIKLRYGYIFIGFVMGLVLLIQFIRTLPDGKLHITVCDVGQGDGTYLRFPDGRDMVVDGGPGSQILTCLGKVMPFWDRKIDAIVLTHPDQDHFRGLIDVVKRYQIGVFIRSDIQNPAPLFRELEQLVSDKKILVRFVTADTHLNVGAVAMTVLWPAQAFLSQTNDVLSASSDAGETSSDITTAVESHRNDYAVVFHLRYGSFDGVFTADADERVEPYFTGEYLSGDEIEFLKVPRHGSRNGMTDEFLSWIHPKYAVISVGARNTYGHPSPLTIEHLQNIGTKVFRTDKNGSVSLVTDGKTMSLQAEKQ